MRRFLVTASGITLAMLAVAGCSLFVDLDGLGGGSDAGESDVQADTTKCVGSACDSGGSGDGSVASDAGPESGPCDGVGTAGPRMVPADGYCIDSTEISIAQYTQFLTDGGAGVTQPGACNWNMSFAPDTAATFDGDCTPGNVDDSTRASFPITCIDWCDAWSYCAWAGKRLCGNVTGGGAIGFDNAITPSAEWYLACSTPAGNTYATGSTYDGGCNVAPSPSSIEVGSDVTCVGGYPGLFDMAGNVEEWIDACDTDGTDSDGGAAMDNCRSGGDSFRNPGGGAARCDSDDSDPRDTAWPDIGVRCCAPLP